MWSAPLLEDLDADKLLASVGRARALPIDHKVRALLFLLPPPLPRRRLQRLVVLQAAVPSGTGG